MSGEIRRLDLRGLRCPLPALRTRKAIKDADARTQFEVLADDPLAGLDVPNAVREAGGEVLEQTRDGATWRFVTLSRSA